MMLTEGCAVGRPRGSRTIRTVASSHAWDARVPRRWTRSWRRAATWSWAPGGSSRRRSSRRRAVRRAAGGGGPRCSRSGRTEATMVLRVPRCWIATRCPTKMYCYLAVCCTAECHQPTKGYPTPRGHCMSCCLLRVTRGHLPAVWLVVKQACTCRRCSRASAERQRARSAAADLGRCSRCRQQRGPCQVADGSRSENHARTRHRCRSVRQSAVTAARDGVDRQDGACCGDGSRHLSPAAKSAVQP